MTRCAVSRFRFFNTLFALLLIPILFAACSQNNVTEDNSLKKYFDSAAVSGSFGMFDNGQGHFTIYNLPRFRDSAYLPAATFDILQSLIGVQTGLVKDDSAIIATAPLRAVQLTNDLPDSVMVAANKGLVKADSAQLLSSQLLANTRICDAPLITLQQAFQYSCENAFSQLALRIGKDTLKKWIDSLGYGNKNIGGSLDSFWLNNRLKITSDEQLGLVKKLYFDQLPFFQHTQVVVRRMMQRESNANYQLSYKTALGVKEDGHRIGWILGWIEENKHPYFFVLNLESANPNLDINGDGINVLKGILKQMEFFQGKK
jgi:beta-lactamase class D